MPAQDQRVTLAVTNHRKYLWPYGVPSEYIDGTIRITFGEQNSKEDVDFLVENLEKCVNELRE